MNSVWVESSLERLEGQTPAWLDVIPPQFDPTQEFYRLVSSAKGMVKAASRLAEHISLPVLPSIEIVSDSNLDGIEDSNETIMGSPKGPRSVLTSKSMINLRLRVSSRQLAQPLTMGHVLARAVMRHLMRHSRMRPARRFDIEMYTDLAMVRLGLGKLLLNSAAETSEGYASAPLYFLNSGRPHLGYPLKAYAYFLVQRGAWGRPTTKILRNMVGPCVDYLKAFRFWHSRGTRSWSRLLANAPAFPACDGTATYNAALRCGSEAGNSVKCPRCGADFVVPKLEGVMVVFCPKCWCRFDVGMRCN